MNVSLDTCCSHLLTIIVRVDFHFRHASELSVYLNPGEAANHYTNGTGAPTLARFHSFILKPARKKNHTINRAAFVCLFVCLSVCLFVPYLLRGPLTDLRQTWWVYAGGPRNCP